MKLRKEGEWFRVSPWVLIWDNEFYYLIACDAEHSRIKHYRVDKMLNISTVDEKREGKEQYKSFDITRYSKSLFGMFGGEETKVTSNSYPLCSAYVLPYCHIQQKSPALPGSLREEMYFYS